MSATRLPVAFWQGINPDTVVCARGRCRVQAVKHVDEKNVPLSDPWGWTCEAHNG